MLIVPVGGADKKRDDHIPALKWVLAAVIGAIVSTVGGSVWISQELLATHPIASTSSSAAFLFGSANKGVVEAVTGPLLVMGMSLVAGTACVLLAFVGIRSVRLWGTSLIRSSENARQEIAAALAEAEARLGSASTGAEFWKGQAREASEKARVAEAARVELERGMDQLSLREKALAREQGELCQSKNRLEKHVELRTIEVQRLQRRYVSILNCAGEGICSCDLEGRVTFANPAAASMMGWSVEELIGQDGSVIFADRSVQKVAGEDGEELGQTSHLSPIVFQRKDGSKYPVEAVQTPVEESGRQVGSVLIFKDVTERTEADERFAAKTAELSRSNSELEQFAFVASHDLQEPLRKIQAFGDRLKTRVGDDLTPVASDYLCRMQSAAARMQGLIDGLLMYSRVLTRGQPFTQVDLTTVVNEVIEDLEVRIEKEGAEVKVDQLPTIEADPLQIRQLLQNLIGNALKFQPPGNTPQVTVSARIVSGARALLDGAGNTDLLARRELCELTVMDNGIGFDEAYLKRLFVVFQRLHSRSEFEGTGIGLAVCRKIASRHGGSITARSKSGEGATFIVLLPLQQEPDKGGPVS